MTYPVVHSEHSLSNCSILLLAGGRGQRMGGQDKGWVQWQGKALVEHMHHTLRALTDDLIISCNRNHQRYATLADQLISDPTDDFPGPLIGIIEALKVARHPNLIILPCDAPRVDQSILSQLREHAGSKPVMLRQGGYWQPLFSLLPVSLLPQLQAQWQSGQRSPQRALLELQAVALDYPENDLRLSNFNDPTMLVR